MGLRESRRAELSFTGNSTVLTSNCLKYKFKYKYKYKNQIQTHSTGLCESRRGKHIIHWQLGAETTVLTNKQIQIQKYICKYKHNTKILKKETNTNAYTLTNTNTNLNQTFATTTANQHNSKARVYIKLPHRISSLNFFAKILQEIYYNTLHKLYASKTF